jgi:hypothetical protein
VMLRWVNNNVENISTVMLCVSLCAVCIMFFVPLFSFKKSRGPLQSAPKQPPLQRVLGLPSHGLQSLSYPRLTVVLRT